MYKINIATSIPKHITIAGHSIKTLYTGQQEALVAKRQQKPTGATAAEADKKEMESYKRQMHEVLPRNSEVPRQSFIHPDRSIPPKGQCQTSIVDLHDRIHLAVRTKSFQILENTLKENTVEEFTDPANDVVMERRPLDAPALLALATSSSYHHLPRQSFDTDHSFYHLTALSYYIQFGYASAVDLDKLNFDVFIQEAVDEWIELDKYKNQDIVAYGNEFVECFKGFMLVLPKDIK